MNRKTANIIRYCMDELIPPIIRDNKYFMYPFFYLAYRGNNIEDVMNFKKLVYGWSYNQYLDFYDSIDTISRNRLSDLSTDCIQYMLQYFTSDICNTIDVGCGKGYFLDFLHEKRPNIKLTGLDIVRKTESKSFNFEQGMLESLNYPDRSFDIVVCSHTLEHIIKPDHAIKELIRITGKLLIIVVPCQRPFFYTLDEHVNFFYHEELLCNLVGLRTFSCKKIAGDWVYVGKI